MFPQGKKNVHVYINDSINETDELQYESSECYWTCYWTAHVTELHMLLNRRDKSISPTCSWRNYIKSETTLRRGVAKQPSNVKGEKL